MDSSHILASVKWVRPGNVGVTVVTESPFWQLEFIIYSPFARPPKLWKGHCFRKSPSMWDPYRMTGHRLASGAEYAAGWASQQRASGVIEPTLSTLRKENHTGHL